MISQLSVPECACAYEVYDPSTLEPENISTYTRLLELGWNEELFAGKSVLDIGSNSGILSLYASQLGASTIKSVDVQDPLIDFFSAVVDEHELLIEVVKKSFNDLMVEKDSADIVLFMEVLHWIVDQGGNIPDAISKLAALTNETLFVETPWDVKEPSIASKGVVTDESYNIESILRELQCHFQSVQIVRFMTYFGRMQDSKRVLIKATGRRANSLALQALEETNMLDLSVSRGSNSLELVTCPDGPRVLKKLPTVSLLAKINKPTRLDLFRYLESRSDQAIVAPLRLGDDYVLSTEEGNVYMVFPFVGHMGNCFPATKTPPVVDSPLQVAVRASKVLSGVSSEVVASFRDCSHSVALDSLASLETKIRDALQVAGLTVQLEDAITRMHGYDRLLEDSLVHHNMQGENLLKDDDGNARIVDLDLMRSGPVYADILSCAIYHGVSLPELEDALHEAGSLGGRALSVFDIYFSIVSTLSWANAFSEVERSISVRQLEYLVSGLQSVVTLIGDVKAEAP